MGLRVHDQHHVVRVKRDAGRVGQIDLQSHPISIKSPLPRSDHGGNDAGLVVDFPNPIAARVTDVEIIARVKCDSEGKIQTRLAARPAIPAVAGLPDAREIVERAFLQIHPPHTIRPGLRKVQVAFLLIHRDMHRERNARLDGQFAIPGAPGLAIPGECFNIPDA